MSAELRTSAPTASGGLPEAVAPHGRSSPYVRSQGRLDFSTKMYHNLDLCDEFYINVNLNTEMELPNNRDTILHYFEQMKKAFPDLRNFFTRENGDFVLEGDKENSSYRWLAIEPRRLCSGAVNPDLPESAYKQHELVLEIAPHLLTVSSLDCEALDVLYGFDFSFEGNHDEVVAEALGVGSGLDSLLSAQGRRS